MKMKNFLFELSIKIMLIADKKGLQKHCNFFMNNSGYLISKGGEK
ncbi:MAG: hypothetical protein R6V02_08690 [Candidatus Aminicenantes bacterium]